MLENDKVILRPITEKDTNNILKWRNSKQVKKYFLMQEDLTKEQHEYWLKNIVNTGKAIQFIIVDKESMNDVGTIYVRNIDKTDKNGEYGIYIGDTSCRGKGLGYFSSLLICDYCFKELKLHKLYLRVLKDNKRAISLYKKIGFKKEGIAKEHVFHPVKGYLDVMFMSIIDNE